jgi:type I restriction enzyme, S subunit
LGTASDWKETALGDLIRLQKGVSYKGEFLDKPGPRLLGLGTIALGGGLVLDKARTYSGPIRNGQKADPGDLIVAVVGITPEGSVIGSPALIPSHAKGPFAITHHVARATLIGKDSADLRFLYYFLRNKDFLEYVRCVQFGSTVPAVALQDVLDYAAPVPPLAEQRAIARVLGSLDDKIEINRRMNSTLEQIAQALFKSWFVDFDPVRAKAEGRWNRGESLPGMPADMWDLWPSEFEESEIGEIPNGWLVKRVEDELSVLGGSTPSTAQANYWDGGTHAWATPKDLAPLRTPVLTRTERQVTDAGLSTISSGLLPAGTVLLSSRAPIGYLAIAEVPVAVNQGFIAIHCEKGVSNHYALRWCSANLEEIMAVANGTTFLEVNKQNFRQLQMLVPPSPVLDRFDGMVAKWYRMEVANEREIATLGAARDALLPKLLSGEIRVRINRGK